MGLEISKSHFEPSDFTQFQRNLRLETILLKDWVKERAFCNDGYSTGLELEAWITTNDGQPNPVNQWLLSNIKHPQVVCELSRFSIELNGTPQRLSSGMLSNLYEDINGLWKKCRQAAEALDSKVTLIGVLPTVTADHLNLKNMTPRKRYEALNERILDNFNYKPVHVHITGKDELKMVHPTVMLASAATSLQVQWKVPFEKAARAFNAAQIISAPLVALSANSPFVFGKSLWDESRIPLFEHAISGAPSVYGAGRSRAIFGSGYIKRCISEFFVENMNDYSVLLPFVFEDSVENMSHLNLHNGTIWRWNRPVIGANSDGTPHVRIEHRAPSAGPTLLDSIANLALFIGISQAFCGFNKAPEELISFSAIEKNFYRAAKYGLNARLQWFNGATVSVRELLLEYLIPLAKQGLRELDIGSHDIEQYIDSIIIPRVLTGQTGAQWQKNYLTEKRANLEEMTHAYLENQESDRPVHEW